MRAFGRIGLMIAASAAIMIVAFILSQTRRVDRPPDEDPLLAELRANNSDLDVNDEDAQMPAYWIKDPGSSRSIPLPKDEAPGAKIRFVDCDRQQIPANLLYPNRTKMACAEVRNPKHVLASYYFETKDRLAPMVDFFELNVDPDSRLTASRTVVSQRTRRKPFTKELIVFYMLKAGRGFVGYPETKN
jgi:hypothetical protein